MMQVNKNETALLSLQHFVIIIKCNIIIVNKIADIYQHVSLWWFWFVMVLILNKWNNY